MSRHRWPEGIQFEELVLTPPERDCPTCGGFMSMCDHRHRFFYSLDTPIHLITKLVHCTDLACPTRPKTYCDPRELSLAMPKSLIAWDVFAWIGHRRFARDWSIPEIQIELREQFTISLSETGLRQYIAHYQTLLAARQQDPAQMAAAYAGVDNVLLSIDGLQPEKGHETLYVVRELRSKRVWFAAPLLSSAASEVQPLFEKARDWAAQLGKPVVAWVSDKQNAFVKGIDAVFPGIPHRYCRNHFLRGAAKPMMEADSHAKVQMRSKVRGLRAIERTVLEGTETANAERLRPGEETPESVVLDYCATVRGVLNANQGGPLDPPGLRMAEGLKEIHASLERCVEVEKGGSVNKS